MGCCGLQTSDGKLEALKTNTLKTHPANILMLEQRIIQYQERIKESEKKI
jgi:hypothetical protein